MARILLIDDDASLREVLAFALADQGHEVETAGDGASGIERLAEVRPDLVITDLKMPGLDGMEVLRRVRASDPEIPVIVLTAFGRIEEAVAAMQAGAHHYLTKPYNREELKVAVEQALDRRRLLADNRSLRERLREQQRHVELIHASESMERVMETIRRIAPSDATVLISGESGTGKELVARALHTLSDRWERPFVAVNCAAIPHDLLESELFGHERGAFTGAWRDKPGKFVRADGGTLLLDEIADLAPELQSKLLRVIETGSVDPVGSRAPVQVDVRIVVATNADLEARVREGRFRSDLFYRLNVIPIHLPPLRQRPEDVPALWEHFLARFAAGAPIRTSSELLRALMRRPWPGNVRELANLCQRMVLLRGADELSEDDLRAAETPGAEGDEAGGGVGRRAGGGSGDVAGEPADDAAGQSDRTPGALYPAPLPDGQLSLPELERELIVRALEKHRGNKSRAAAYLGVPRHVFLYRMEKFGLK